MSVQKVKLADTTSLWKMQIYSTSAVMASYYTHFIMKSYSLCQIQISNAYLQSIAILLNFTFYDSNLSKALQFV
jgi:hypothetical protein